MNKQAIIGTYWKTEAQAVKDAKKKSERFNKPFYVYCFNNGYLVSAVKIGGDKNENT